MRIIVVGFSLILGLANVSRAQSTPPAASATAVVSAATTVPPNAVLVAPKKSVAKPPITKLTEQAELSGYASCGNRKYNPAYGENTIKVYRQKDDRYLVKSSKFLKKNLPLYIKGWISEKDCKAMMLREEASLEIEAVKAKTLVVSAKGKLTVNRIYFVTQVEPSQLFKYTYLAMHVANLSDEEKRKSSLTGFVFGTQIHANSLFRLSVELQSDKLSDKATSANTNIFFAGFASCAPIDSLSGKTAKIDLCAKLLAGKSSDPNLHVKYNFSPQLNFDFGRFWRVYGQAGLTSIISRSKDFSENAFGMDLEAGLAYRF